MQLEQLRPRSGAKRIAHPNGPDSAGHACQRDVFHIQTAIEKERKPRTELIDRNSARGEHLHVCESIRERVSGLLYRRRPSLADVIAADRNRIPARHFARGEFHHIGEKPQRRLNRKNGFVLRLDFLKNVGLDCATQFWNNFRTEPAFGCRDVHRHDDRGRPADRHRCGKNRGAEVEAVVEPDHVFDGVDRDAAFTDFSEHAVCVAIDAVQCRSIECRAEAMCALVLCQIMKTLVGILGQHQTGKQTRRLFCLRNFLVEFPAVLLEAFNFANRLEVHLTIGRIQIWKLTW
jgi:hypothetical protein